MNKSIGSVMTIPLPEIRITVADRFRLSQRSPMPMIVRFPGACAAAFTPPRCDQTGTIRLLRKDIGRHNAFDKLIGAMARAGGEWEGGFALLTSRCSFEFVEKAVLAGCALAG